MSWLPDDFVHPVRVPVPGTGLHLRPIRGTDVELDHPAGGEAERALDVLVPRWIAAGWPFRRPRYIGRDISWPDWLALPSAS
jgi:hypothetical protein